jgi:hypothetical protein
MDGVIKTKCTKAMCGVSIMDRISNEEVRRTCASEVSTGELGVS